MACRSSSVRRTSWTKCRRAPGSRVVIASRSEARTMGGATCADAVTVMADSSRTRRMVMLASLEICPRSISFSPPGSPCCMPVMGRSGARLAWTAAGDTPTAVDACANAARAPQPIPSRKSVQKILPLKGSRDSWIPFMARLLVVDDELRGHDVAGMARLGDGDARLHVREHRTIRVAEAVLEPQVDPVQMVARASVGHA